MEQASPRVTFTKDGSSVKNKLPRIKFEDAPLVQTTPKILTKLGSPPKSKETIVRNPVERMQVSESIKMAREKIMTDRAKTNQWDSRVESEAQQINSHLVEQNIKTTYNVLDSPEARMS